MSVLRAPTLTELAGLGLVLGLFFWAMFGDEQSDIGSPIPAASQVTPPNELRATMIVNSETWSLNLGDVDFDTIDFPVTLLAHAKATTPIILEEYVESLSGMTVSEWNQLRGGSGAGMGFYHADGGRYLVDDSLPVIAYKFLDDGHFLVKRDITRDIGGRYKSLETK